MLRVLLAFLFWPIYAISVTLHVKLTKDDRISNTLASLGLDARREKKVDEIAAALEMFFHESFPAKPIIEYREIFDRYIGLTFAIQSDRPNRLGPFTKIVPGTAKNVELNSICINRRNRRSLEAHRNRARIDFLGLVAEAWEVEGKHSAFVNLAQELCRVIADDDAFRKIELIVKQRRQMRVEESVNTIERELWHSQTPKPSATSQI